MNKDSIKYIEPADYFPKQLRKRHKLDEYAELSQNLERNAADAKNV